MIDNISMKALFIYNSSSGKGKILKRLDFIKKELSTCFNTLHIVASKSEEHLVSLCIDSCGTYDSLLFAGGDGTFNIVANALLGKENRPTLGIIPSGTVNDAAKNFGITRNIKKAVKIIKKGKVTAFDICSINDKCFVFAAAIGAYADIPYATEVKKKKYLGALAYYLKAIPSILKPINVEGYAKFNNGEVVNFKTPFILIMNGTNIGGFKINPKSIITDGKFDLFLSRPSIFNSLLTYLFFRRKVKHFNIEEVYLSSNSNDYWDIDGEQGPKGNVVIKSLKHYLSIYSK